MAYRLLQAGLVVCTMMAPLATASAQDTASLGGCLIITVRHGATAPTSLKSFCEGLPAVTYQPGVNFQSFYSWTTPVLSFAFDEAERGLSGSLTGVTGSRTVRIVLVMSVLANAGVPIGAIEKTSSTIDIFVTSSLIDFTEGIVGGYVADALRGTSDQVTAMGYEQWLVMMRREIAKQKEGDVVRPVRWPGPGYTSLAWNMKYVRTPAQSIYELIFAHELSHIVLGLPSGGATASEELQREIRVDSNAFRAISTTSPHRDDMVMKGGIMPSFIVSWLVAMWYFENLRGRELREGLKSVGSPQTFQGMFPARDWRARAAAITAQWESICRRRSDTTMCRAGWEQGVVEARQLIAAPIIENTAPVADGSFDSSLKILIDGASDNFAKVKGAQEDTIDGIQTDAVSVALPGAESCTLWEERPARISCRFHNADSYESLKKTLESSLGPQWNFNEGRSGTTVVSRVFTAVNPAKSVTVKVIQSSYPSSGRKDLLLLLARGN